MNSDPRDTLRSIPSVDQVLDSPGIRELLGREPRAVVLRCLRTHLEEVRRAILSAGGEMPAPAMEEIVSEVTQRVTNRLRGPQRVLNATGIVLHTNLGRARLAPEAVAAVVEAARGACDLELDLGTGKRSSRGIHLEGRLVELTGADAAFVVNNNAGALVLALNELAQGREAIVSRGELVEIGGSFRLPDVMARTGARLVEVGTTNRTTVEDYERAICPQTAVLLKVHRSNFRQEGFVSDPPLRDLVALGERRGLPVIHDLGSGALHETEATRREPSLKDSLAAGVALVTMSGDKLLGGPQAGIILGRREVVARLKKNPLARALRVDKFTVAALAATLDLLEDGDWARKRVPTLRALSLTAGELQSRAQVVAAALQERTVLRVRVVESASEVGGGAVPGEGLPTSAVALAHDALSADALARELRRLRVPVVGRIVGGEVLLDPRSLAPEEDEECVGLLVEKFGRRGG
jgi:L-seryl-tRNA(Ser) seleniumtransferase